MCEKSAEYGFDPEVLRGPDFICEPDPRSRMWVRIDRTAGTSRAVELTDHHHDVSAFSLHAEVPKDVAVQFDVARNLYLYAWFVYRFYTVAEHHSLAVLEFALRDRLKDEIRQGKLRNGSKPPMLRALLKYAVGQGIIKNQGFERWRRRGEINSRARVEEEKFREMSENNLPETLCDESEIEVTEEDLNWDFANVLVDVLPYIRNEYAHGTTNLHNLTLQTIQVVSEIINQLYESHGQAKI
jgi:hypothetical protein